MTGGGMSEAEEQVAEILAALGAANTEEERKEILESISPILTSPSGRSRYKAYLETTANLEVVFDCVNASKAEVIAAVVVVLGHLLDFLDPVVVLSKYFRSLQRCLDHPDPQVRRVVLRFLHKCSTASPVQSAALVTFGDLVKAVVKAVVDEDLGVSKEASKTVHSLASKDVGGFRAALFQPPALEILAEMSRNNKETLRMRFYDFVVSLCKISPEMTSQCTEFLKALCAELTTNSDDLLLKLNVLEVLWDLAETRHGFLYLKEHQVLANLDLMINQVSSSPYASLLMPGFIKFFGRVAQQNPSDFSESYPTFTSTLFALLGGNGEGGMDTQEEELRTLALETVGFIATTPAGKRKLNQFEKAGDTVVCLLTKNLSTGSSQQKIAALSTIANILKGNDGDDDEFDMEALTENFYGALDAKAKTASGLKKSMMEFLFELIKQPFADVSEASYLVLIGGVADKRWGLVKMVAHPGLIEFLLDRSMLSSKEAKDIRYQLVKTMLENPSAKTGGVPAQNLRKMEQYVKEGPYHVESLVEVALDEGQ